MSIFKYILCPTTIPLLAAARHVQPSRSRDRSRDRAVFVALRHSGVWRSGIHDCRAFDDAHLQFPRRHCHRQSFQAGALYLRFVIVSPDRSSHCDFHDLQIFPSYKAGDVIIASNPNDPNQIVCKRIIAMPREKVYSHSGLYSHPTPPLLCFCQAFSNALQMVSAHHRTRGPCVAAGRQPG